MTEAVAPIHGRRLDARYTLLEKLGSGGQGEVWRAHDETRGIDIALKVLTPTVARSQGMWTAFEHEYAIASRLDHASVLKIFPPQRSGEVVVLPMELATGGDLRRLRGAGYLEIIPVLLDIAEALEHAHERGVIHRDLKPGNVLFDARGRVRLADFGAAGTTEASAADTRLQGLSPFTASPEQLRGEPPTPGDDIYGLGALAYELLSGYPPYYPHFDAKRAQEDPVPDLVPTRQIPPLLGALVMRMLAKNPKERPRSMREIIDELDAALNDTLTFDFETVVDTARRVPGSDEGVTPGPETQAAAPPPQPPSAAVQAAILAGQTVAFSTVESESPAAKTAPPPPQQRSAPTASWQAPALDQPSIRPAARPPRVAESLAARAVEAPTPRVPERPAPRLVEPPAARVAQPAPARLAEPTPARASEAPAASVEFFPDVPPAVAPTPPQQATTPQSPPRQKPPPVQPQAPVQPQVQRASLDWLAAPPGRAS
jgi:serine/threonine protein kinase